MTFASAHRYNRRDNFRSRRILGKIPARASLRCTINLVLIFVARKDDNQWRIGSTFQLEQKIDTADFGHAQIEKHQVDWMAIEQGQRLVGAVCGTNNL